MYKIIFLIRVALFSLLLSSCNSGDNTSKALVNNAGFEESIKNSTVKNGWVASQHAGEKSYEMFVDEAVFFEGSRSFKIQQIKPQVYGLLAQVVTLPDATTEFMNFSAMLRTKGVIEPGGWALVVNCLSHERRILKQYLSTPIFGDTEWTRIFLEEKLPEGTAKLSLGVMLQSEGTGWIDDVKLELY